MVQEAAHGNRDGPQPLSVLVIGDQNFVDLLEEIPELWLNVARSLVERVAADDPSG